MSKLRVHDLAGEFGIPSDEVVALLRVMDVSVRSHMSALTDDQVARVRARWEREKRARAEKPTVTATATRRRRTAAPEGEAAPKKKTAKKTSKASAAKVEVVEEAPPPVEEIKPTVRRRRRAEVEAQAAAEAAVADAVAAEVEAREAKAVAEAAAQQAAEEAAAAAERAAQEKKAAEAAAAQETEPVSAAPAAEQAPASVAPPTMPAPTPRPVGPSGLSLPERPRPRPVVPGAPRPKPVSAGLPRPIASATPGGPTAAPGRPGATTGPGGARPAPGQSAPAGRRGRKGKRGADQVAVAANLNKTMRELRGTVARRGAPRRGDGAEARELIERERVDAAERERLTVRVNEFITVSELAGILGVPATQIVAFAFKTLGLMVTINQRLDFDQIELIASEFGFQAVREEEYAASTEVAVPDAPESLVHRPPVVTIMGHVDHGKTSLLDFIRRTNVVAGESGGITQHIGAYHVELEGGRQITFLDTPGHEAFTAMRARGAQVTDIVVLVVAADDSVMPQTVEAISHARNAGVPMIVAINKIDLPAANAQRVKNELLQHEVVLEEFGGQTLSTELSAKTGANIESLLDQLLLQAEILDLKANPDRNAAGTVVEAQLDPGKGPVATVLVQNGTLRVGDAFICGMFSGRVRALLDERGRHVKSAGPAIPVQILGLQGVPLAGDQLLVVTDANEAREIAQRRERLDREAKSRRSSKAVSLESFMAQAAADQRRALKIVIKGDQGGPAEALADALVALSNPEVEVEVVQRSVGAVTESDILFAKAAGAIILGFHVRPDAKARAAAEREGVDIRLYKIIYEAVNDVKAAIEGMLRPEEREVILGEAEVRQIFKVSRVGTIAGCIVRSGIMTRTARVRVIRDGVEVFAGTMGSLKRFKDDAREVKEGFECGIGVDNFNDVKVGDVIECFKIESVARTLADTPVSA